MTSEARLPRWFGWGDVGLLAAVVLWWVWVLLSPSWTGHSVPLASPYLVAPLLLLVGVVLGRALGRVGPKWPVLELVGVFGLAMLIAVPLYANAQGAIGVQLVALSALILLTRIPTLEPGPWVAWTFAVAVGILVVGVLLSARSDAASVLGVLLAFGSALVVAFRWGPPERLTIGVALTGMVWAAVVVVWLGSLGSWPSWLSASTSLSSARHELWADALALWRQHPLGGGGVGSFTPFSELASSTEHLERAHSVVLQVGSELGLRGVLLLAAILLGGLAVAVQGSRPAGAIAAAAWTFLAIHSMIDHLWEFPAVVLTSGAVLGWARSTARTRPSRGCSTP